MSFAPSDNVLQFLVHQITAEHKVGDGLNSKRNIP